MFLGQPDKDRRAGVGKVGAGTVFVHREPQSALLLRAVSSRDQGGKYTGSPAPSPSLLENVAQKHPSVGPGFNHPPRPLSSAWRRKSSSQSPSLRALVRPPTADSVSREFTSFLILAVTSRMTDAS